MKKSNIQEILSLSRRLRASRRKTKERILSSMSKENNKKFIDFFKFPDTLMNPLYLSNKWLYGGFIIDLGEADIAC